MKRLAAVAAVVACVSGVRAEVVIETVTVGNPGNPMDMRYPDGGVSGFGGVDYVYNIGTFEVTAGQYAEFLNAVAAEDTYGLYNTGMWSGGWLYGCKIERTGSSPNYEYSVAANWADRPVNYIDWGDVARFCNWLHNGQRAGVQELTTTEDGSYYLNGATSAAALLAVVREPDATWVIPSEDEWYKAAYHYNDGVTGNYWDYPTESDTVPTSEAPPGTDMTNGSANYYGSDWAIGSPYYRTVVGAYDVKPSDSPYGTFDQGGNLWEWNEAVLSGLYRGLRGGSFNIGDSDDSLRAAVRGTGWDPPNEYYNIGFRVATFTDCNANSIPDECDPDCGATFGLTGGLCSDVFPSPACGQSADTNTDGVPDECGACCHSGGCDQVIEATCDTFGKYHGNATTCEIECPVPIPAVSEWGLVILALLTLTAGSIVLTRRRGVAA